MTDHLPMLLVEDDEALAELVGLALRDLPVTITHVETGAAALAALDRSDPAPRLVLLDLDLPDMRGLEVLERHRADDPARTVPIVVFSSSEEPQDIARAAQLGANSYVHKPAGFDRFREDVTTTVRYWTQLHRAPESE
jgi:CheY-like chemotaxis protein